MTATYVLIAFAGGVVMGAVIILIATRRHAVDRQILDQVQRIGAVFANTAQRGRAGEIVLENLLEASGMGRRRDFEVQASLPGGGRPDVVLTLPGRGRLFIDAKFPLSILWGIAHGLQQDARARHGQEIGESAAELHRRLGTLVPDLQKLGNSLTTAAARYNGLLAVLEGKVLPEVRRLESLGIFAPGTQLPEVTPLDAPIRPVAVECYQLADDSDADEEPTAEVSTIDSPPD